MMNLEHYHITIDPVSRRGELELHYGNKVEKQLIKDFKLMENREIIYHSTEGDVIHIEEGPIHVSLSMMRDEVPE